MALASMLALPIAAAAQTPAPPAKGGPNVSMCTGCHTIPGYQASFPRVYHVPKISGQSAKYIEAALRGYKSGERGHPTMRAIATTLSDEEIAALAAYYAERGAESR
jgi:cytochrome c553